MITYSVLKPVYFLSILHPLWKPCHQHQKSFFSVILWGCLVASLYLSEISEPVSSCVMEMGKNKILIKIKLPLGRQWSSTLSSSFQYAGPPHYFLMLLFPEALLL